MRSKLNQGFVAETNGILLLNPNPHCKVGSETHPEVEQPKSAQHATGYRDRGNIAGHRAPVIGDFVGQSARDHFGCRVSESRVEHAATVVDGLPLTVEHSHVGMPLPKALLPFETFRLHAVVLRPQSHELSSRTLQGVVEVPKKAHVLALLIPTNALVRVGASDLPGPVQGSVIPHKKFEIATGLAQNTFDAFTQVSCSVVDGQYDGEARRRGHGTPPASGLTVAT